MNHKPVKITVATVTYNAVGVLQRTLDSVAAQDYAHVEHLIIDGNSHDGTLALFQHYQENNSRAGVIHEVNAISEPDKGIYDAMNKALAMATGDYIVFLNAGDRLHGPDTLQKAFAPLAGTSPLPAVVYGETDLVDADGKFVRHRRLQAPGQLTWKDFRWGMLVCHQSFYARTDLARQTPYDLRYRFSADYDWCLRLLKRAEKERQPVFNTHQVLTDYLSEGLTTRNHKASLRERFRIMARHFGWPSTVARHLWFVLRAVLKK